MESIIIKGGKHLSGKVNISGSKNASLPILALSILVNKLQLYNIPCLADVSSMLNLLKSLGIKHKYTDRVNKNNIILHLSFVYFSISCVVIANNETFYYY